MSTVAPVRLATEWFSESRLAVALFFVALIRCSLLHCLFLIWCMQVTVVLR